MILYSDEDVGTRVPNALKLVGCSVVSAVSKRAVSEPDVQWLERVRKKGWLGLSCNKNILRVPEERDAIISNKVGIVFINEEALHPKDKLLLLLRKWEWMKDVDSSEERPFAYFLYTNGSAKKVL